MANIKISELSPLLTVQDADVIPIVDNAITKKVTAEILRSYTQGNSVLLTGAQTIAGIKTFTSQLASTVATGTAPFSVASTTKVTNLNADLLDGLSSADFALSTRTLTAGTGLTGGGDLTANRTFAIDSTVATLTGTQTLTNKTITSPVINEILDSNGNEILGFTPIASATDYITIKNGIGVGVPVHISAAGSSANTGLHLEPKGTGLVQISDGTDTTKGFRFRSSGSAASAVTLLDAVSSAGRVITLPDATTTLVGTNTTDTLTNKSISGATNTLSNIGNASLTNSAITINGTSTSLGGSINVGTVTSVAALTLGTSGTDVSSTVATGTTTPVITLNVPTASASNRGALSSADWSTFNAKQNAITLTTTGTSGAATLVGSTLNIPNYADTDTGITSLNGLTALTQTFAVGTSGTDFGISSATSTHTFNLPTASAANRGALSSADWTTFNNKQNALTNPITGTGTTNYLPKFTGASALGNSNLVSDANGQLGLGVTPSAWDANFKALQIGVGTALYNNTGVNGTFLGSNFYYNGTDNKYIATGTATAYGQINGSHNWFTVASGTAGDTVNFTQAMTLDASGKLLIGTTYNGRKLNIGGSAYVDMVLKSTSASGVAGGGTLYFGNSADEIAYVNYDHLGNYMNFGINNSERMRIAASGNFLIGTTTDAGYKLDVNGTARVSGATTINGAAIANTVLTLQESASLSGALGMSNRNSTQSYRFAVDSAAVDDGNFCIINSITTTIPFLIAPTGAATFSSSVTAKGDLFIWGGNAAQSGFITGNSGGGGLYIGATGTNQNIRLVPSGTGITQATTNLDVLGSISIANPVAAAVAVASTHKVTIVIGGVTYYLLATNV